MEPSADPQMLDAEVYCPACGYSLRGNVSGRCPECGQVFDPAALTTSRIHWMRRREIGRFRAWWRTLWQATFRPGQLVASMSAPVPYADARSFWLINALLTCALPVAGLLLWDSPGEDTARLLERTLGSGSSPHDLTLVALMGLGIPGTISVAAVLFLLLITGMQTYLFQRIAGSRVYQDRAAALALYASGAWSASIVLIIAMAVLVLYVIALAPSTDPAATKIWLAVSAATLVFVPWVAIYRLHARVTHAHLFQVVGFAAKLSVLWLLALLLCGGLIGLAGLVRIIVLSVWF